MAITAITGIMVATSTSTVELVLVNAKRSVSPSGRTTATNRSATTTLRILEVLDNYNQPV